MMKRCGFVSVLGLPNAGKSTLVNALVGSKVSIVSKKVQTTRCRILGIAMEGDAQVVLMDTPGIFAPKKTLEKAMVGAAWGTLDQADAIVHLVDTTDKRALDHNEMITEKLPSDKPCLLALNKTDKVKKPDLLTLAADFNARFHYDATFMISALNKEGIEKILPALSTKMPEGDWMFDPEQSTDIPMRFMAAEITREKVFHQLHEELPYAVMVETEEWENFDNGDFKISQIIYVQRETQKAIVVGKGGSRIKELGAAARVEMEEIFGAKVHLKLFVKVQENWSERAENLAIMGLGDGL
jgi:GTP-binding protein Era